MPIFNFSSPQNLESALMRAKYIPTMGTNGGLQGQGLNAYGASIPRRGEEAKGIALVGYGDYRINDPSGGVPCAILLIDWQKQTITRNPNTPLPGDYPEADVYAFGNHALYLPVHKSASDEYDYDAWMYFPI